MFIPPHIPEKYLSSWAQYSILIPDHINRQDVIKKLNDRGIPSMVYYKLPVHIQEGYKKYNYKLGDFPISEKTSEKILSLPMHPYLSKDIQNEVISALDSLS